MLPRISLGRTLIAPTLLLICATLLPACKPATLPTTNTEETTMEITQEPITDPVTDPVTEPTTRPVTDGETLPEDTPAVPDHDTLMAQLAYSAEEKALLAATAETMKGLRVIRYSDTAATQKVSEGVAESANAVFPKGSGVSAVVLEGFITFDKDGTYTLTYPDAEGASVTIMEGEHHIRAGASISVEALAGARYGIKLTAAWDGDAEDKSLTLLCNGSEGGFTLTVGRVLLEHEPVSVTPILDIPLRDTYVCVGPDGYYYMTGTTGPDFWDNNYVIHIYRSADLVEWEDLGVVWDFRTDATWAKKVSAENRVPVWAPELAYINGNWYLTYSMGFWDGFCGGILVSTTGRPEGPYTDTANRKLVDNIDGSLFQDDDGTVYYIYKDGMIATLNDEMNRFTSRFVSLYAADGLPVGFEGCSILKHNGKYYLTAATYNQSCDQNGSLVTTYDSMIAVSDNIYGPYSETRLLLRNGGHNNLFVDKDGNLWTTLFAPTGTLGFNCQPAIVPLCEDERGILTVALPE